jgi:4-diphosphocytidyl-2-C-methyl-D-erythritol kinase
LKDQYHLPELSFYIHKTIPFGAGLGGGSANAAYTLKAINAYFNLNISDNEMLILASKIGSDCAFFIKNKAIYAQGKGDVFKPIDIDLSKYYLQLVHPGFGISTAEAYASVKPKQSKKLITDIIKEDINTWKDSLKNDFENHLFKMYPELETIKRQMYENGALYASMSGSGSAVYGIFENDIEIKALEHYWNYQTKML